MDDGTALRHTTDAEPGIRRLGTERRHYTWPDGTAVRDRDVLRRIEDLVIPPAWTDVWISPDANGHLQATGRDARGRKQSRYHPRFRAAQEETKFASLVAFGDALTVIRTRVARDLAGSQPSRRRQTALVLHLLDVTAMRIGNEAYVRENGSFGLSTLRSRQARVRGAEVTFTFVGKSGKPHRVSTYDRRIARLVHQCQDLPGQRLFTYLDEDGRPRTVESGDVNEYLRNCAGGSFTAKTFRTWTATSQVATDLGSSADRSTKARFLEAIDRAAARLGNTRAVCRRSYVHPAIEELWFDGSLAQRWRGGPRRATVGLSVGERRTLHLLRDVSPDRVLP